MGQQATDTLTFCVCAQKLSVAVLRRRMAHVVTLRACVEILQMATNDHDGADTLLNTICDAWKYDLPAEPELRKWSRLQQEAAGTGSCHEFATTILWTTAIQAVMERENTRAMRKHGLMRSMEELARCSSMSMPMLRRARST